MESKSPLHEDQQAHAFSIERKFVGLAKIGIVAVAWPNHGQVPSFCMVPGRQNNFSTPVPSLKNIGMRLLQGLS